MRFLAIFSLIFFVAVSSNANPVIDNALSVRAARGALVKVMRNIAEEIDGLQYSFPQLKNWRKASISASRIEYQYHYEGGTFKKDGCRLLIIARTEPLWDDEELKVGVYLKMKAVGKKAELLKKTLMDIVGQEFKKIRSLRKTI